MINGGYVTRLKKLLSSKLARYLFFAIVFVVLGFGISRMTGVGSKEKVSGDSQSKIDIKSPRASEDINKEFSFSLKDSKGNEINKVSITVEKAEIRDELIVKGKKASSIKGRTFLVLNLKLKNDYSQAVEIKTRDFIRLSVNGNEQEWLAPEVHNDPVEVQAISTKLTRVAFPINETDHDFVLQTGEISGDKEKVKLNLKF